MKPFHQLSNPEILALTTEQLSDSIRIGALDRGIEIPITLSEALRTSEYRGYEQPVSGVKVWCPCGGSSYNEPTLGYLSEAEAEAALRGIVVLGSSYRNGQHVPGIKTDAEPFIKVIAVGHSPALAKAAKLNLAEEASSEAFDKYRDECLEKYNDVRQSDYNRRVRAEHRAEYLRLAGGDEEIAKAFYVRTGKGAWPKEDGSIS